MAFLWQDSWVLRFVGQICAFEPTSNPEDTIIYEGDKAVDTAVTLYTCFLKFLQLLFVWIILVYDLFERMNFFAKGWGLDKL